MSFECSNWAVRQNVRPSGRKFVLVILATWANQDGVCWGLQQTLASYTGQSVRSVHEHLAALEAEGYIKRHKRYDREGHRRSDAYTLDPNDNYAIKDWTLVDRDPAPKREAKARRSASGQAEDFASRDEAPSGNSLQPNRKISPTQPEESAGSLFIEERSKERPEKDQGGARARDAPDLLDGFQDGRSGGQVDQRGEDHAKSKRGRRLPADWRPSAAHYEFGASEELEFDRRQVDFEADKFRDYWLAESGSKTVKRDWDAAFRNWLRRAAEYPRPGSGRNRQRDRGDVAAALSVLDHR